MEDMQGHGFLFFYPFRLKEDRRSFSFEVSPHKIEKVHAFF